MISSRRCPYQFVLFERTFRDKCSGLVQKKQRMKSSAFQTDFATDFATIYKLTYYNSGQRLLRLGLVTRAIHVFRVPLISLLLMQATRTLVTYLCLLLPVFAAGGLKHAPRLKRLGAFRYKFDHPQFPPIDVFGPDDDFTVIDDAETRYALGSTLNDDGMGCWLAPQETEVLKRALEKCQGACQRTRDYCGEHQELIKVLLTGYTMTAGVTNLITATTMASLGNCLYALYLPNALVNVVRGCHDFRDAWKELQQDRAVKAKERLATSESIPAFSAPASCELSPEEHQELHHEFEEAEFSCTTCTKQVFDQVKRPIYKVGRAFERLVDKGYDMLNVEEEAREPISFVTEALIQGTSLVVGGALLLGPTHCISSIAIGFGVIQYGRAAFNIFKAYRIIQRKRLERVLLNYLNHPQIPESDSDFDLFGDPKVRAMQYWQDRSRTFYPITEVELKLLKKLHNKCKDKKCRKSLAKQLRHKMCVDDDGQVMRVAPYVAQLELGLAAVEANHDFRSKNPSGLLVSCETIREELIEFRRQAIITFQADQYP